MPDIPELKAMPLEEFQALHPEVEFPKNQGVASCGHCGLGIRYDNDNEESKSQTYHFLSEHDLVCTANPLVTSLRIMEAFILRNTVTFRLGGQDMQLYNAIKKNVQAREAHEAPKLILPEN